MTQQVQWVSGNIFDNDEAIEKHLAQRTENSWSKIYSVSPWAACYAGLTDRQIVPEGMTFFANITTLIVKGFSMHRYERSIRYWIGVGKSFGLKFGDLKWRITKVGNETVLVYFMPTTVILKCKNQFPRKYLLLHLFFFRFVFERAWVIDLTRAIYKRCKHTDEKFNRLSAFMLADIEVGTMAGDKLIKKWKKYAVPERGDSGHYFLQHKSSAAFFNTMKEHGKNLNRWFLKGHPYMNSFDKHLLGGTMQINYEVPTDIKEFLNGKKAKAVGI